MILWEIFLSLRRKRTFVIRFYRCEQKVCFIVLFLWIPHDWLQIFNVKIRLQHSFGQLSILFLISCTQIALKKTQNLYEEYISKTYFYLRLTDGHMIRLWIIDTVTLLKTCEWILYDRDWERNYLDKFEVRHWFIYIRVMFILSSCHVEYLCVHNPFLMHFRCYLKKHQRQYTHKHPIYILIEFTTWAQYLWMDFLFILIFHAKN